MLDDSDVERILFIAAHPDDVDFGAGGTIASWVAAGKEISYCICTDGDAGGFDPEVPRTEIPVIRRQEQRAAARQLGVNEDNIHFLGYSDGSLTPTFELRGDISRVIRQVRPQRVVTQSSQRNYEHVYASHPDHLAAGEAALCAVYPDSRNPFVHTHLIAEGLDAWSVPEVWIMGGPQSNHAVDTTDLLPIKLAALRAHVSQTEHLGDELEQRIRTWNSKVAEDAGLGRDRLAESFLVIATA